MQHRSLTLLAAVVLGLTPCAHAAWPWSKKPCPTEPSPATHHPASSVAKAKAKPKAHPASKPASNPYAEGLRTGAEVATFDVGRKVKPNGDLDEAHQVYRVVQSSHWNINLPWFRSKKEVATPSVYTPPNASPIPADQRINDAVAEAKTARDQYRDAARHLNDAATGADALKDETASLMEKNAQLQAEIDGYKAEIAKAFHAGAATPSPSPLSEAAKAGEAAAAADELKSWSQGAPASKR